MTFMNRRLRNAGIFVGVLLLAWSLQRVLEVSIRGTAFSSGTLLLLLILVLAAFNARKKLPFLPLGSGAAWMQFHAYAGLFSILVFLVHVRYQVPNGSLEGALGLLFALVAGSGGVGLVLSRVLPGRLTTRGEAILYERIPLLRRQLHEEVEALVLQSAKEVQTDTISDFYSSRLIDFLCKPRNFAYHIRDSGLAYQTLEHELWALDRYANPAEHEVLEKISECVRLKDDLDFQWTQQLALRGWLFFHIPMTYSLMIVALLHVLLVLGFDGSIQ